MRALGGEKTIELPNRSFQNSLASQCFLAVFVCRRLSDALVVNNQRTLLHLFSSSHFIIFLARVRSLFCKTLHYKLNAFAAWENSLLLENNRKVRAHREHYVVAACIASVALRTPPEKVVHSLHLNSEVYVIRVQRSARYFLSKRTEKFCGY